MLSYNGRSVVLALALAGALAAASALAQENPDEGVRDVESEDQAATDLAFLRECLDTLAARGAPARVCIDMVARQCGAEPGGETSAGALACEERESNAWSTILSEAAAELEQGMSNTERERFGEAQDAWAAYRDAQCAYESALFEDEEQQSVERTACVRRVTATRTISLHERQAEIKARNGG
jgi:uncharacterized protein YecT (DUF1311 family)